VRALPLSLAAEWGRPVGASFLPRSLSLCLAGLVRQCRAVAPRLPFSLSAPWVCLVSSSFPALAVDRRVCNRARRRVSRPRRPPTHPAPLFRASPVPVHTPRLTSLDFTFSRALPTPPPARDPRPRSRPSSSPETAPSLPELHPKVRHSSPCPISSIAPCARPISPSLVLGHGGPPCSRGGRPI
jgi:hypothetical protein